MVTITGKYLGNKRVEMTHEPSGSKITTSAPKDNNGDGLLFSPTDLAAASYGSCVLTTIAIVADRDKIDLTGAHFSVEKHMNASPRRIGRLPLTVHLPSSIPEAARQKLENAGHACPVHHSLHPEVEAVLTFVYDA